VVGPGGIFRQVVQYGIAKGLLFLATKRAESGGARGRPGGVGGKGALLGPHLMDIASHELPQTHERIEGERQGEGIV